MFLGVFKKAFKKFKNKREQTRNGFDGWHFLRDG